MKKTKWMAAALVVGLAGSLAATRAPATAKVGSAAPGFTLADTEGKTHSLSDYQGKILVIEFDATRCPVSQAYDQRMNAFYDKYAAKDGSKVAFLAINANENPMEDVAEIKAHSKEVGAKFAICKDTGSKVADIYGAAVTPHMYVIDAAGVLRYIGAFDDDQKPEKATKHYVEDAVDALLAGKSVTVTETKAFGCAIKRTE